MVIISQYIQISNDHGIYLEHTQYTLSVISDQASNRNIFWQWKTERKSILWLGS